MQYSEDEINFAKKVMQNELTEVQFNYLIHQNNFDKKKIEDLIDNLYYIEPFSLICKMILIYIMFCFLFCFISALFNQ